MMNKIKCRQTEIMRNRDHFVNAPSQCETTLHCNIISHWLGADTKWSLQEMCNWDTQVIFTYNYCMCLLHTALCMLKLILAAVWSVWAQLVTRGSSRNSSVKWNLKQGVYIICINSTFLKYMFNNLAAISLLKICRFNLLQYEILKVSVFGW